MKDKKKSNIQLEDKSAEKEKKRININKEDAKAKAKRASAFVGEKAEQVWNSTKEKKKDIEEKLNALNIMLESAITEYNDNYTLMNDKGIQLFIVRNQALDNIGIVEKLINSISNYPKTFDAEFKEIDTNRECFINSCEFGQCELQAAREAAGGAGAGLAAGASVAFMAPSAAMWIATTFGTASTGTAISTLSGAAATNAALAWLGGGALAAGGGGIQAGNALLAMAGPIGWTIAGVTLLGSVVLFTTKKLKNNKRKNEEIEAVKRNTEAIKELGLKLDELIRETEALKASIIESYMECIEFYKCDYQSLTDNQKEQLGILVNNTKAISASFKSMIGEDEES